MKPEGYEACHIVDPFDLKLVDAHSSLAHWGIPPNAADNGVFLPGPELMETAPPPVRALRRFIRTTIYGQSLARRLALATSHDDAIAILARLRHQLEQNGFL